MPTALPIAWDTLGGIFTFIPAAFPLLRCVVRAKQREKNKNNLFFFSKIIQRFEHARCVRTMACGDHEVITTTQFDNWVSSFSGRRKRANTRTFIGVLIKLSGV